MREIQVSEITKLVKEHCIRANKILPCDMECRMREACKTETSPLGKEILKDLVTIKGLVITIVMIITIVTGKLFSIRWTLFWRKRISF